MKQLGTRQGMPQRAAEVSPLQALTTEVGLGVFANAARGAQAQRPLAQPARSLAMTNPLGRTIVQPTNPNLEPPSRTFHSMPGNQLPSTENWRTQLIQEVGGL